MLKSQRMLRGWINLIFSARSHDTKEERTRYHILIFCLNSRLLTSVVFESQGTNP